MSDLLTAQAERPASLRSVNMRTLSPFQRSLLVIDGTVTKFIEAYTMEPVDIIRLSQDTTNLAEDHVWLEAAEGSQVTVREVLLRSRYGDQVYAYARALIVQDRLPNGVRERLEVQGESIGLVLNESKLETHREVLWYGRERLEKLPKVIANLSNVEFISRTYRIIAAGQPIMMINERFPCYDRNRLPAHH
jgi:chorismate-pyruvate lyase